MTDTTDFDLFLAKEMARQAAGGWCERGDFLRESFYRYTNLV